MVQFNVSEGSPLHMLHKEHEVILLKYFNGVDGKFSTEVLKMAKDDISAYYNKYAGDKSRYVQNLCSVLFSAILYRYSDCLQYGKVDKNFVVQVPEGIVNHTNALNIDIPEFYKKYWDMFSEYINTRLDENVVKKFLDDVCTFNLRHSLGEFGQAMACTLIDYVDERNRQEYFNEAIERKQA